GSVTVMVTANDSDADNDTLDVTSVTQGANGSVVLNADDTVTYTPGTNFNGSDSFTYTVIDGNGGTDTATVTVSVGAANDAPNANDDTATVAEDGTANVTVLTNDSDLDNDTLAVTSVTQGTKGSVVRNADNTVTYTPNANANGTDSFTYTISDGNGGTDTATVAVTITPVNDAPVAVDDSASTLAEVPVTIQVRTNDTDIDSPTLTVTAVTQGAHGSVAIDAGQTVTYTPAAAWIGPDTFTYTISDGSGGSATATVNVDVQAPARVSGNIQVLYTFDEGSGTTVTDVSGVGTPLNLTIGSSSAVTWLPGALSIDTNTLVKSASNATKVINASKASNEVTMEAWVVPANLSQTGPAAIVTLSQNHTKRNVTLGQSGTAYNGQLRTSTTNQGGTQLNTGAVASLNLSHVVYTRSSTGAVRIYVDGTQVASSTLTGNLSGWSNYELALGGEASGTRYWLGDLHLVAIYSRALTATEVRTNFLAGAN
ncbi:MAG: Ig-like domain-containing protein, partial [Microbacteriaceae bacterium]